MHAAPFTVIMTMFVRRVFGAFFVSFLFPFASSSNTTNDDVNDDDYQKTNNNICNLLNVLFLLYYSDYYSTIRGSCVAFSNRCSAQITSDAMSRVCMVHFNVCVCDNVWLCVCLFVRLHFSYNYYQKGC